jgi:hypothetical protein
LHALWINTVLYIYCRVKQIKSAFYTLPKVRLPSAKQARIL